MTLHIRDAASGMLPRSLSLLVATITFVACQQEPTSATCCNPIAVTLSASALSLTVGDQRPLYGWAVYATGRVAGTTMDWSSADVTIAVVGAKDGLVTAISPGTTKVTATFGTLSATATVSVRPALPPSDIAITPAEVGLLIGGHERLNASLVDSTNKPIPAAFEWSSADPTVATIGQSDGLVTGVSDGTTTVTVASGAFRATVRVTVIALAGPFAFTRINWLGGGDRYSSDVLLGSADGTPESLQRTAQFPWIAMPAWSPDGSQLVLAVIHRFEDAEGFGYDSDLYALDASAPAGSPWRALTKNGFSNAPSWSPDGTRIAYLEGEHVHVLDTASGTSVQLTTTAGWYSQPRWSPDGTRLVFSAFLGQNAVSRIYAINADGTRFTDLPFPSPAYDPDWSPDGSKLVFVRFRGHTPTDYDLVVGDTDGQNVRHLATSSAFPDAPTWSHDGRQILFTANGVLYVTNADGSGAARVTTPPEYSADRWPVWRR